MARSRSVVLAVAALVVGVLALALWVAPLSLRWLDLLVAILFAAGLGAALFGYFDAGDVRARRLGVVAIGWNAFGLLAVVVVYALG